HLLPCGQASFDQPLLPFPDCRVDVSDLHLVLRVDDVDDRPFGPLQHGSLRDEHPAAPRHSMKANRDELTGNDDAVLIGKRYTSGSFRGLSAQSHIEQIKSPIMWIRLAIEKNERARQLVDAGMLYTRGCNILLAFEQKGLRCIDDDIHWIDLVNDRQQI